jgi:hypothetical protein
METPSASSLPSDAAPRGHAAFKALLQRGTRRLSDLVALSPKRDPFCAGTPGQVKMAEWFHGIWQQYVTSALAHLRRIHYLLVSQVDPKKADGTPYLNTEACWQTLQEASAYARYLGLVDPRRLEDHRNPEPHLPFLWEQVEDEPRCGWDLEEIQWTLPTITTDLAADLALLFPEPLITGYDYSLTHQRYHLEVWIEKSTMNDVLLPVVRRAGAVLVTSVGFQSVTSAVQLITQRVKRDGKPTRLFYISDFDPAGDRMPVALARQIEFWLKEYAPDADIKLQTLALLREQVQHYQLPRVPIKETDLRKAGFEDRYGEGAVELDALEALQPGVLAELVQDALASYIDESLEEQLAETADEVQAAAAARWLAETQPWRDALATIQAEVEAICARFAPQLAQLADAFELELAPHGTALRALQRTVTRAMRTFYPDLPGRPQAAEVPEEETTWLYNSARAYFDQLHAYKAHGNGTQAGEETEEGDIR